MAEGGKQLSSTLSLDWMERDSSCSLPSSSGEDGLTRGVGVSNEDRLWKLLSGGGSPDSRAKDAGSQGRWE